MYLRVKLFATLAGYIPGVKSGVPFDVEVPKGIMLADLMKYLKLPEKEVKIAFVDGRKESLNFRLQSDSEVGIFPPIGGG